MTIRDQVQAKLIQLHGTHGETKKLCDHLNLSQSYLTLLRKGKRTPSVDVADRILAYQQKKDDLQK